MSQSGSQVSAFVLLYQKKKNFKHLEQADEPEGLGSLVSALCTFVLQKKKMPTPGARG
jgi:hypothetical protein